MKRIITLIAAVAIFVSLLMPLSKTIASADAVNYDPTYNLSDGTITMSALPDGLTNNAKITISRDKITAFLASSDYPTVLTTSKVILPHTFINSDYGYTIRVTRCVKGSTSDPPCPAKTGEESDVDEVYCVSIGIINSTTYAIISSTLVYYNYTKSRMTLCLKTPNDNTDTDQYIEIPNFKYINMPDIFAMNGNGYEKIFSYFFDYYADDIVSVSGATINKNVVGAIAWKCTVKDATTVKKIIMYVFKTDDLSAGFATSADVNYVASVACTKFADYTYQGVYVCYDKTLWPKNLTVIFKLIKTDDSAVYANMAKSDVSRSIKALAIAALAGDQTYLTNEIQNLSEMANYQEKNNDLNDTDFAKKLDDLMSNIGLNGVGIWLQLGVCAVIIIVVIKIFKK